MTPPLPERYTALAPLGHGGMADVWRVHDRELSRTVALKVFRGRPSPEDTRRFLRELQTAARLQHPGIVPVHDAGILPDGRHYFTMPVAARTLATALAARPPGAADLHGLVSILHTVALAVAFARRERVFHRDLKPSNILLGDFSEVYVADWGIARRVGDPADLSGTRAYMAPERLLGAGDHDEGAAEVWSLGALLHEVLVGAPPQIRSDGAAPVTGTWEDLITRAPAVGVAVSIAPLPGPEPLRQVCAGCLSLDPHSRPNVEGYAHALQAWLDGTRRREEASRLLAAAAELAASASRLAVNLLDVERDARSLLDAAPLGGSFRARLAAWDREDAARTLRASLAAEHEQERAVLTAAVELDPEGGEARERLAAWHQRRHLEAEAASDTDRAREHLLALTHHDRAGRWIRYREGRGAVTIHTDPPGAQVWAWPMGERRRRRGAFGPEPRSLGSTPVDAHALPHGSWALLLVAPGHHPVRYPVQIGRLEHWDGVPPGGREPTPIPLPRLGSLNATQRYVPAGWFRAGGDPDAPDPLVSRRLWVDGFVMERATVTLSRWFDWLNRLAAEGRWEEVERHGPATRRNQALTPLWIREGDTVLPHFDDTLIGARPDWPITQIDWYSACAFAQAESERTGLPWRLPHDLEWEKAARGVDGRAFPWGDAFDPGFTAMAQSFERTPDRVDVVGGLLTWDRSVYGVIGLAGNVRCWCATDYARRAGPAGDRVPVGEMGCGEYRMLRGGSWLGTIAQCRSANRPVGRPDDHTASYGVRLVRSVVDGGRPG